MKKYTAFIAALLAVSQLAACGGKTGDKTPEGTSATTDGVTTAEDVFQGLEKKTFNGREFNFLIRETEYDDYYIEKETGDVLDDAVYRRNTEVEQLFDVKVYPISIDGSGGDSDT